MISLLDWDDVVATNKEGRHGFRVAFVSIGSRIDRAMVNLHLSMPTRPQAIISTHSVTMNTILPWTIPLFMSGATSS